ncbi:MAG: PA2169 family four-helix-bundle protein [Rudaea sp.]|nr:PA2169 family four-helix-bundle protein [Rudaea sp.]
MSKDTATLNDMIEVLNDGKKFYEEAATQIRRADLKALFSRMARTKDSIASDLRTAVVASGAKPAEGGSFAGALRTAYAEIATKLSSDKDYTYIAQLEEFEDRILHAFQNAQSKSEDEGVRTIAQRYMPEVIRDHNEMRGLKQAKAA